MVDSFNLFDENDMPQDVAEEKVAPKKKAKAAKPKRKRQKSASAYRTISEVAEMLGVATHVLRFWETKFNEISPMKRGGGRRYYRPEDVEILTKIKTMLHDEGYTIKGVQAVLSKKEPTEKEGTPTIATDIGRKIIKELQGVKSLLEA